MYEVRDLRTGGKGLFATQDIPPGTLILSDRMLLSLETKSFTNKTFSPGDFEEQARTKVVDSAKRLSAEKFEIVKTHCKRNLTLLESDQLTQENLLDGNKNAKTSLIKALSMGGTEITRAYIYDNGGRVERYRSYEFYETHHSRRRCCNPNAHESMPKHDKETLDLRAMKLIKKGEEITFCPQNPFQPKKKRQDFVCGSRCGCEICTRKPDEEGVPNENLYIGLERRFEKITKFMARFFKELENVTFGDAEGWDEMQKRTKQINAVSEVERKSVVKACRWVDEQRRNLGLMHPCFAKA